MYSIYADDLLIHSDVYSVEDRKVIKPKLVLEEGSAGSLTITIPPVNVGYGLIQRMITEIRVLKDNKEIWSGRVLSETKDFWNNRVLYCEGELAYLNDSVQPPEEYKNITVRAFIENVLQVHNSKVLEDKQFSVGAITVHSSPEDTYYTNDYYTNYEKTIESLAGLVNAYGGRFRIRRINGVRYLDYLAEYPNTCQQIIQFGKNLIDFTRNWDSSEFATVILPLGATINSGVETELDAYVTIESVNEGSPYVFLEDAMEEFGRIEKTVVWSEITDPGELLEVAEQYITELQFDNLQIELSAIDLHYLNVNEDDVQLLDKIRVISKPHGLDRLFPVTKLEIPLDSPEQTTFSLGANVRDSFTAINSSINSVISKKINEFPKNHSILKEAKDNATEIIKMATTGFITITSDEDGSEALYITDTRDYTAASKMWKWNLNGLGYSKDGGMTFDTAITMDGAIVADFITTGSMSADLIQTGILKSENENVVFNLNDGTLEIKSGSIQLGEYTDGHYNFEVSNDGRFYAGSSAIFAGQLQAASGTFAGIVVAEDFRLEDGTSMMNDAYQFKSGFLDLYGLSVKRKSDNVDTFTISDNGDISINAKITMAAGSSINWANVSSYNDKWTAEEDIQKMLDGDKTGPLKGTFIDGRMIKSATIIGSEIYWGDNGTYGSLTRGTGSASGTETNIVELYSNDGIVIRANGGGMRLESTKGIWLNNDYTKIYVRYDGSYISLGALISELTSQ